MRITRPKQIVFLLALSVLTFVPFLGRRDIVTSHEARVVQVARQMAESGRPWNAVPISVPKVELETTAQGERLRAVADGSAMQVNPWIVPVMNGQVRLQKPPLPYWCTAVLYRFFGGFSEAASRIIPALMGSLSVLLVWDLCRRLSNRRTAWYAALVWISTFFIVDEFRKAMADPYLAFFTLAALWAWVRGISVRSRIAFYVALGLGILSKGPLIFVFVLPMIAAHTWCWRKAEGRGQRDEERQRTGSFFPAMAHVFGVVLLLLICLPWPIAVMRAVPNAPELWRYESLGALSDKVEDVRPFWFYLPNLLLITLPWTPVWALGIWVPFERRRRRRFFGVVCTLVIVFIFSCSPAKKSAYLLPLTPILCLVAGRGLTWLSAHRRLRPAPQAIARFTLLAVGFSMLIQFAGGVEAWRDNNRSPRDAAMFVQRLLAESPRRSILIGRMPEDATPYLPLGLRDSPDSDEVYVVLDDRKGLAQGAAERITETPAGRVISREAVAVPDSKVTRWKVYRLIVLPIQRAAPGAG